MARWSALLLLMAGMVALVTAQTMNAPGQVWAAVRARAELFCRDLTILLGAKKFRGRCVLRKCGAGNVAVVADSRTFLRAVPWCRFVCVITLCVCGRVACQLVCIQGSFQLDVETLEAEGEGCGMDNLDIQVLRIGFFGHVMGSF